MYKFPQCGYPKYFEPFLIPIHSVYNIHRNHAHSVLLEVPHFASSVYKSTMHFGLSFAYYAPKIWNDLLDNIRSPTYLYSFGKK